jgi:hypothetical protein
MKNRFHLVILVGLNERVKKILSHYNNQMYLIEYDEFGRSLSFAPNGKQGIFCISPDGFWRGWFVLDDDVRFDSENKILHDIINIT